MPSVQAVLFDYGLVLSGPADPASWERMKLLLQADETSFHAAYWNHRHAYDRGNISGTDYWQAVAADVNQTLSPTTLASLIEADTDLWTQPNQPMIDWAAALQRAGIKTGILSNIGDEMETGVLNRCPWLQDFAHHTFSHNLKIAKPELAIYQHAAAGLAVPPSEILFIDDREDNIAAAREAGMQTVQYTSHEAFLDSMHHQGFQDLLNPEH
jgi:putative hydrolase of the HAD superfamily